MSVKSVTLALNGQTYNIPQTQGSTYSVQVSAPSKSSYNQSDHIYPMSIRIEDQAGNITEITQAHATYGDLCKLRVLEKVAPVITITSPSAGATLTQNTPTISFKVTDNDAGVDPSKVICKLDNSAITPTRTSITGGYQYTFTCSALSDGSHSLTVEAADYDGNVAAKKTVSFKVDTAPPNLNLTAPGDKLITNQTSCTVSGTTNDAVSSPCTVKITLNGTDQGAITVNAAGAFSKMLTLKEGGNTIVVTSTDAVGKSSSVTRTVTLDTHAPVVGSVEITPNPVDAGELITITLTVTD